MTEKEPLYICMGSACHQLGVYKILPVVQQWLASRKLDDRIELKGTFCLGACQDGMVFMFRSQLITGISHQNVEQKLEEGVARRLAALDPAVVDSQASIS
ncbi:MAG TPA: (2Fe-2S) ferredoxin domain-containing protein [Anaerolineaceae bacterium]|jgi:NADH:ubiquinone oxidoreductase subunit E|nr:(2Fe-2S) ferredoxin domain-containing protein [Anaerolineaceae bacterium]